MADSVFTKIIKGELPCHKIYEDDRTIAFLTIEPVRDGHALVVSKKQVDHYMDLPDEDYQALWQTVRKVSKKIRSQTDKERVAVVVEGIDVPHAHVHLIPFSRGDSLQPDPDNPGNSDPDHLAKIAAELKI